MYLWDLGLQTRGHCGLLQPAALPPALIGYSVAVTSTRPTPFALPLCQGVTGLCLRVEFWRRSSVLVVPSLGTLLRQGDWEQPILRPQTTLAFSQRVWDPDPRGDADAAVSAAPGAALRAWPGRPDGQHVRGVARPSATVTEPSTDCLAHTSPAYLPGPERALTSTRSDQHRKRIYNFI